MGTTHTIKHGDTLPVLNVTLYRDAALTQPVDLTTATQVMIKVEPQGGEVLTLNTAMTVDATPTTGKVSYQFKTVDWVEVQPGTHNMEFEVTWNNGDVSTYPKVGYASLDVQADLD